MARHHSSRPIPPFPADIDRQRFGDWLSGFTDGEGHFQLRFDPVAYRGKKYECARVAFVLALRADDHATLALIQSYLGCGELVVRHWRRRATNTKPTARLTLGRIEDCELVVRLFEEHPLRAKKARDFALFKEGVALVAAVSRRPWRHRAEGGMFPKWSDAERTAFRTLCSALKAGRVYDSDGLTPPPGTPRRRLRGPLLPFDESPEE